MRKTFTRLLSGVAFTVFATLSTYGASDSNGNFIYCLGDINGWPVPSTENAAALDDYKLYETAPGSNIYAGHFASMSIWNGSDAWFRFVSDLYEASDENSAVGYRTNVIAPLTDGYQLKRDSFTGVLTADRASAYPIISQEPGSWRIPNGEYTLIVNLNNHTVSAFSETEQFIVMKGEDAPDFSSFPSYRGNHVTYYADAGNFAFNLYNIGSKKWAVPSGNSQPISAGSGWSGYLSYDMQDDATSSFEVTGWNGGIVTFDGAYLSLTPDDGAPANTDVLYLFTPSDKLRPWEGASNAVCSLVRTLTRNADGNYSGVIPVSALADGFNLAYKLGGKGEVARQILCPANGGDLLLSVGEQKAFSSAKLAPGNEAGMWIVPEQQVADGGDVTVTATLGQNPSVTLQFPSRVTEPYQPSGMYLRGAVNYWGAESDWEFVTTKVADTWILINKTIPAYSQFKIADITWGDINLGGNSNQIVFVNSSLPLVGGGNPDNLSCNEDFTGDIILSKSGTSYTLLLKSPSEGMEGITAPDEKKTLYLSPYEGAMWEMHYNNYTGMYTSGVGVLPGETLDLHIFTKIPSVTYIEPEWASTNSLSALTDGFVFDFDEYGVGEGNFIADSGQYKPLTIYNDDSGSSYFYINVDLENNKIYVEREGFRYLCGEISGGKAPTIKHRADFKNLKFDFNGSILDFPAGDLKFVIVYNLTDGILPNPSQTEEVILDENGIGLATNLNGWSFTNVIIKNWKGGKAFINGSRFIDIDYIRELSAYVYDGVPHGYSLEQVTPGSALYKGHIWVEETTAKKSLSFMFELPNGYIHGVGLPYMSGGVGYRYNNGKEYLVDNNGVFSAPIVVDGCAYYLPTITGAAQLDVTLDLEKGTLDMTLVSGTTAVPYESVSEDGSFIDGVTAYPSTSVEDAVTLTTNSPQTTDGTDTDASFNFTTPKGEVIAPASGVDTEIVFDNNGCWTGDIAVTGGASASRRVARAKAASTGKWHFSVPADEHTSYIQMMIDRRNNKLTVHSSAHNRNFFIFSGDAVVSSIENIDEIKSNMLSATSEQGVYTGEAEISDVECNLSLCRSLYSDGNGILGLSTPFNIGTLHLDQTNREVTCFAWARNEAGFPNFASFWPLEAPLGKVYITFDSNANALTFSLDMAGVENVSADTTAAGRFRILPGNGCITVIASEDVMLPVYSVSGMLVKMVDVKAGTTEVDLPAGYYIAGGHKIMVR